MEALGAGLASLAFWGFLSAVILGGIWYGLREREAQYETVRRIVESGQNVDQDTLDRILGGRRRIDQDLRIAGLILLFAAPGLGMLGWFLGRISDAAQMALFGVAALAGFVASGLLVAAYSAKRSLAQDDTSKLF